MDYSILAGFIVLGAVCVLVLVALLITALLLYHLKRRKSCCIFPRKVNLWLTEAPLSLHPMVHFDRKNLAFEDEEAQREPSEHHSSHDAGYDDIDDNQNKSFYCLATDLPNSKGKDTATTDPSTKHPNKYDDTNKTNPDPTNNSLDIPNRDIIHQDNNSMHSETWSMDSPMLSHKLTSHSEAQQEQFNYELQSFNEDESKPSRDITLQDYEEVPQPAASEDIDQTPPPLPSKPSVFVYTEPSPKCPKPVPRSSLTNAQSISIDTQQDSNHKEPEASVVDIAKPLNEQNSDSKSSMSSPSVFIENTLYSDHTNRADVIQESSPSEYQQNIGKVESKPVPRLMRQNSEKKSNSSSSKNPLLHQTCINETADALKDSSQNEHQESIRETSTPTAPKAPTAPTESNTSDLLEMVKHTIGASTRNPKIVGQYSVDSKLRELPRNETDDCYTPMSLSTENLYDNLSAFDEVDVDGLGDLQSSNQGESRPMPSPSRSLSVQAPNEHKGPGFIMRNRSTSVPDASHPELLTPKSSHSPKQPKSVTPKLTSKLSHSASHSPQIHRALEFIRSCSNASLQSVSEDGTANADASTDTNYIPMVVSTEDLYDDGMSILSTSSPSAIYSNKDLRVSSTNPESEEVESPNPSEKDASRGSDYESTSILPSKPADEYSDSVQEYYDLEETSVVRNAREFKQNLDDENPYELDEDPYEPDEDPYEPVEVRKSITAGVLRMKMQQRLKESQPGKADDGRATVRESELIYDDINEENMRESLGVATFINHDKNADSPPIPPLPRTLSAGNRHPTHSLAKTHYPDHTANELQLADDPRFSGPYEDYDDWEPIKGMQVGDYDENHNEQNSDIAEKKAKDIHLEGGDNLYEDMEC